MFIKTYISRICLVYDIVRALTLRFFPASRVEYVVDRLLGLINVVEVFTVPQLTQASPSNVNQPDIYIQLQSIRCILRFLNGRWRRRSFSASAEPVPRNLPILREPAWPGAGYRAPESPGGAVRQLPLNKLLGSTSDPCYDVRMAAFARIDIATRQLVAQDSGPANENKP